MDPALCRQWADAIVAYFERECPPQIVKSVAITDVDGGDFTVLFSSGAGLEFSISAFWSPPPTRFPLAASCPRSD